MGTGIKKSVSVGGRVSCSAERKFYLIFADTCISYALLFLDFTILNYCISN